MSNPKRTSGYQRVESDVADQLEGVLTTTTAAEDYGVDDDFRCPDCKQLGTHDADCPHSRQMKGNVPAPCRVGWVCPKCGTANGPDALVCQYCAPVRPIEFWC